MLDTLKIAQSLKSVGFQDQQAEALAHTFAEAGSQAQQALATKADLQLIRGDVQQTQLQMQASLAEVKADMVRWLIASQAVLLMALVALANFTRTFD